MRIPLILTLLTYLIFKIAVHFSNAPILCLLIFLLPVIYLIMNLILRRKLKYKSWFIKNSKLLFDKNSKTISSNISNELLFPKLIEVVENSDLKLLEINEQNLEILASTSVNFLTWGENIYIEVLSLNDEETQVKITSVLIFGSYSWSRNSKNQKHFLDSFEESLII